MIVFLKVADGLVTGTSSAHFEGCVEIDTEVDIMFDGTKEYYLVGSDVTAVLLESRVEEDRRNTLIAAIAATDWMVTRHNEQLAAGSPTSLSDDVFMDLLNERQNIRDKI